MEIESSNSLRMRKKILNQVKAVFYMLRKTITKMKLQVDLHIKIKNGKLARKALTALLVHNNYPAISCRSTSNIDTLFISPQEYSLRSSGPSKCESYNHPRDYNKIKRLVFEEPDNSDASTEASQPAVPIEASHGLSEVDSPLQVQEDGEVDKAAEEFIKNFYRQLKQQPIIYAESLSPNHL